MPAIILANPQLVSIPGAVVLDEWCERAPTCCETFENKCGIFPKEFYLSLSNQSVPPYYISMDTVTIAPDCYVESLNVWDNGAYRMKHVGTGKDGCETWILADSTLQLPFGGGPLICIDEGWVKIAGTDQYYNDEAGLTCDVATFYGTDWGGIWLSNSRYQFHYPCSCRFIYAHCTNCGGVASLEKFVEPKKQILLDVCCVGNEVQVRIRMYCYTKSQLLDDAEFDLIQLWEWGGGGVFSNPTDLYSFFGVLNNGAQTADWALSP